MDRRLFGGKEGSTPSTLFSDGPAFTWTLHPKSLTLTVLNTTNEPLYYWTNVMLTEPSFSHVESLSDILHAERSNIFKHITIHSLWPLHYNKQNYSNLLSNTMGFVPAINVKTSMQTGSTADHELQSHTSSRQVHEVSKADSNSQPLMGLMNPRRQHSTHNPSWCLLQIKGLWQLVRCLSYESYLAFSCSFHGWRQLSPGWNVEPAGQTLLSLCCQSQCRRFGLKLIGLRCFLHARLCLISPASGCNTSFKRETCSWPIKMARRAPRP